MDTNEYLQNVLFYLSKAKTPLEILTAWKLFGDQSDEYCAVMALNEFETDVFPPNLVKQVTEDNDLLNYFESQNLYFTDDEIFKSMFSNNTGIVNIEIDYSIMFDTNYASYIDKFVQNKIDSLTKNNIYSTIDMLIREDFQYDYWLYIFENINPWENIDIHNIKSQQRDLYNNLVSLELFKSISTDEYIENNKIEYKITCAQAYMRVDDLLTNTYLSKEGLQLLKQIHFYYKQLVLFLIGVYKIKFSSNKNANNKIKELFTYSNDVVGAYLGREMIVAHKFYQDINKVKILNKINKGKGVNSSKILNKIKNIARDFTIPRIMELFISNNIGEGKYFIPFCLSHDTDFKELFNLYPIKGIVYNNKSNFFMPLTEETNIEYFDKHKLEFNKFFTVENTLKRKAVIEYNRKNIDKVIQIEFNNLINLLD
ncbi:hypothetical protein ACSVDE_17200 [Pseudalkalibacillus sp. Hm43]|uniref:hypothetical protein n=1 Tax=Pseudalkalibacillus sp. Hm43 TaxID=3450742 RepID=UPI003F443158